MCKAVSQNSLLRQAIRYQLILELSRLTDFFPIQPLFRLAYLVESPGAFGGVEKY